MLEKIEGDPANPYNQGRLCPRCLAVKEMLYHEDRLRYPMRRAKEDRGKNAFERISWDEAYDIIEREMKAVIEQYGNEAIWVTQGTGRDINGYGPLMAQYLGTPNYGTGFLSGIACYGPRIFSTALKAAGCSCATTRSSSPTATTTRAGRRPSTSSYGATTRWWPTPTARSATGWWRA